MIKLLFDSRCLQKETPYPPLRKGGSPDKSGRGFSTLGKDLNKMNLLVLLVHSLMASHKYSLYCRLMYCQNTSSIKGLLATRAIYLYLRQSALQIVDDSYRGGIYSIEERQVIAGVVAQHYQAHHLT